MPFVDQITKLWSRAGDGDTRTLVGPVSGLSKNPSLRVLACMCLLFPGQAAPGKAKLHCVQIVVGLFPVWPGNEGMKKGVGRCPEPHLAMRLDTSVSEQLHSLLDS